TAGLTARGFSIHQRRQKMDARPDWSLVGESGVVEEVWLLGQPNLQRYLHFVKDKSVGGADIPRAELVNEWRAANHYYYQLEDREGGFPDQIQIRDIEPALQPLVDEVQQDSRFRRAFEALPTRFAMVELDRLVVSQPHVELTHSRRIQTRLAASRSPEDLF